ncbi:ATP-grasp domain-containing protein [Streptomyces sulfonofaciens]|nr:ATP-grasp domain-containing protein [Streptomyces sulfonofaciens]
MASGELDRPRLLFFDVSTGPRPAFYLPRLCARYDVHVMWIPSGNEVKDRARAAEFDKWCGHTTMRDQQEAESRLVAFGRSWGAHGIMGFGEMTMEPVHAAANALGLPANSAWSMRALRNKLEQRRMLAKAGVPVPAFAEVHSLDQLREAFDQVGAPAILKPLAGAGSMATFRVDDPAELAAVWTAACASYASDPRGGDAQDFILEEFLIGVSPYTDPRYGPYTSVESLVQQGRIRHLAVTDKLLLMRNFRENGGILPSVLGGELVEELYECATKAINAMGITNSGVHTEIMFTAKGPRVIEVNSRLGGGVTEMLHDSCGFDSVLARAAIATGRPQPEFPKPVRSAGYYTLQAPDFEAVLVQAPSADELRALPEITDAEVPYAIGSRPAWQQGTPGGTIARITAVADGPQPLLDLYDSLKPGGMFKFRPVEPSV